VSLGIPQFGWFVFGLPMGLAAVAFGIGGIRRAHERGGKRLALAGTALGLIGPVASLFLWILIIDVFNLPCC
jgi:hypothetical protein